MFIMMEQHIMFGDDLFDMNHPFNQNMEKFCNRYYKDWQKLNQKIQNNRPNEPRVTIRQTKLISTKRNLSQLS